MHFKVKREEQQDVVLLYQSLHHLKNSAQNIFFLFFLQKKLVDRAEKQYMEHYGHFSPYDRHTKIFALKHDSLIL